MDKFHNLAITGLLILVSVLFFFLAFGNRGLVDMYNLKREAARLHEANQDLEKENDRLRRTMYRLLEDRDYLESVARKELGMVGKDELVYDFKDDNLSSSKKGDKNPVQ
ncbi:FtsB family cell division protein [Desulfatibacillum aliphaticivorans]|uniref:FtsB family cell division protein n=1 Tax=Desulfatibacillum aliphaticivorans TaxID=218208 RepID=UPI000401E93C|nr:septum formation initiator family protein [Desulfatibacillum aliphaticivorans]